MENFKGLFGIIFMGVVFATGVYFVDFGETYTEQKYLGGTVSNVYGETYIKDVGVGKKKRSYRVNECTVTVDYSDGTSEVFMEDVEPVYCYLLKSGDWVDGWSNEQYKYNKATNETTFVGVSKHINIAQEISKRLN